LLKYVVKHLEKPSLTELAAVEDTATKAEMYKWQKKFDNFMEQEEAVGKEMKKTLFFNLRSMHRSPGK